jgi:DDE superfamily endonuclease/Phage integrase family
MNPEDRARPGTAAMKLIAVGSRLDAKKAGHAYLVIDGTLIPIDRVAPDRPFYSGKHRKHRMNLQVIASPDGDILWVSGPLHGAVHDPTAARIWGIGLGEEHRHRVLRVCGKGTMIVLVPLPPAVGRAIDRAIGDRTYEPILLNSRSKRMDRHATTRRLRRLAETSGIQITRAHPQCSATPSSRPFDAGVDLRDVQIAARHTDPRTTMRYDRARQNLDRHPNCFLAAYMAFDT